MKFDYTEDNRSDDDVVAVLIDNEGDKDILIKCEEGWVCLYEGDEFVPNVWPVIDEEIIKKFYPGDKLTITF